MTYICFYASSFCLICAFLQAVERMDTSYIISLISILGYLDRGLFATAEEVISAVHLCIVSFNNFEISLSDKLFHAINLLWAEGGLTLRPLKVSRSS